MDTSSTSVALTLIHNNPHRTTKNTATVQPRNQPAEYAQVGGYQSFAAQSPAVLLARAVRSTQPAHPPKPAQQATSSQGRPSTYYSRFALRGEAISHRIGMERGWTDMASEVARGDDGGAVSECLPVDVRAAERLPPTVLMSSCTDTTVPWCVVLTCTFFS